MLICWRRRLTRVSLVGPSWGLNSCSRAVQRAAQCVIMHSSGFVVVAVAVAAFAAFAAVAAAPAAAADGSDPRVSVLQSQEDVAAIVAANGDGVVVIVHDDGALDAVLKAADDVAFDAAGGRRVVVGRVVQASDISNPPPHPVQVRLGCVCACVCVCVRMGVRVCQRWCAPDALSL